MAATVGRAIAGSITGNYHPPKASRLGYDAVPESYQRIPKAGSRPRDKFDEMYKRRVIAGQVPGDAELRKQKRAVTVTDGSGRDPTVNHPARFPLNN